MKINIMSDVHNEFSLLSNPETESEVVILAGDIHTGTKAIEWAKLFDKPVIYVAGNHEFYKNHLESINRKIKEGTEGTNIHFLNNSSVEINGVRFIGTTLWTDFNLFGNPDSAKLEAQDAMNDYRLIRCSPSYRKLRPIDTQSAFEKALVFLKDKLNEPFEGKTVVVTHMAPSLQSVSELYKEDKLTPSYASHLDYLMGDKIDLWIHGHVHHSNDYNINGTRIISNPRGYHRMGAELPENKDFNPALVIEL